MNNFFGLLSIRFLIKIVGQYTRYYFYAVINQKKSLKSLSNESKNARTDTGKAIRQDLLNTIVGSTILGVIIYFIPKLC